MRAHRNDAFTKKAKRVKRLEDPRARELYDIFKDYNNGAFSSWFLEDVGEAWDNIRQWLQINKRKKALLKKAVSYKAFMDETPLHMVLTRNPPLDIIEIFLKYAPDAPKMSIAFGDLPLHIACSNGASLEVIEALVSAFPEALQVKVVALEEKLPLHRALSSGASLDVIKFLVDAYPEGVHVESMFGELPHHIACNMKEGSMAALNILAEHDPEGTRMHRSNEWVERPFDSYAIKMDHKGMFPLHHACKIGYSLNLIRSLIRSFPDGCLMRDASGLIPLHHVCRNANVNIIGALKVLLDASPESFKVVNHDGQNPFQCLKIVASQRDERGMYLLHRLAYTDEDTIRILCDANPEAIASPDIFSMLPIHHAVLNKASSLEMLMQFIKLDPESLCVVF